MKLKCNNFDKFGPLPNEESLFYKAVLSTVRIQLVIIVVIAHVKISVDA